MTDHRHRPATSRAVFYGRTNQTGPDADRELARQYRLCQPIAERLGELTGYYYDIAVDPWHDRSRTRAVEAAGGPPAWHGGSWHLAADLASPNPSIDMILLADYDRLPRQPSRREQMLDAADRRRCPILAAGELSTPDRDAGLDQVRATARTDPRIVARVLRGIGDGR
jgi:hypothetical protein